MIRFFDYFKESFSYVLQDLEYHTFSEAGNVKLFFKDDVEVEKNATGVDLLYRRRLSLKPDAESVLQVVYRVVFENSDKADPSGLTCQEIHDALYDNALGALDVVASRMSLLVGELMFAGYNQPLILPPSVIREQ